MKYFKTEAKRTAPRYEITQDTFVRVTKRKPPFEQYNQSGGLSQYGICPSCLNPIRLIGLIRTSKVSPYGKHTGKDVNELAGWNQHRYEYCPYAVRTKKRDPSDNDIYEIDGHF